MKSAAVLGSVGVMTVLIGFFRVKTLAVIIAPLKAYGLVGAAVSSLVANLFEIIVLLAIAKRIAGFAWSANVRQFLAMFVPVPVLCVVCSVILNDFATTLVCVGVALLVAYFCLRQLSVRVGPDHRLSRLTATQPFYGATRSGLLDQTSLAFDLYNLQG
jgi:hypothetical protein